jgi:outer membrane biosynthesis protein TonB
MGRFFNYVSLAVLMGGLVIAVILVQSSQELRRFAGRDDMVKICHMTGSDTNPYQQIEVDPHAVPSHTEHGDTIGDCPSSEPPATETPTQTEPPPAPDGAGQAEPPATEAPTQPPATEAPTDAPLQTEEPSNNTGGSSNNNESSGTSVSVNVNVNSDDNQSSVGPTTTTAITTPAGTSGGSTLVFNVGFQGVTKLGQSKNVRVSFRQAGNVIYLFDNITVESNESGVYTGALEGIVPGTYDILVKGEGHLARKFSDISIVRGVNTWNWSATKLRAGDFNNDNKLDVTDVALLLAPYISLSVQLSGGQVVFDIDGNGVLEARDIVVVLTNYNQLEVVGDE